MTRPKENWLYLRESVLTTGQAMRRKAERIKAVADQRLLGRKISNSRTRRKYAPACDGGKIVMDRLAAILGRQPFYLALREFRGHVKLTDAALARIANLWLCLHQHQQQHHGRDARYGNVAMISPIRLVIEMKAGGA
jgi:hypothetical protein